MELLQSPLAITSLRGYYGRTLVLSTSGGSGTGTVSFAVANGSATGCALSGNTLSYTSTGTCLVTASKAGDGSYLSTTSTSTTVTIQRLPIPAATRVTFTANRSGLTAAGRQAIVVLLSKLTNESTVTLIGYAPHNRTLARQRVAAVRQYLTSRLNVTVHVQYVTVGSLNAVRMVTTGQ
jgi:outer membrane protein OmpA-like peptidoglycan-associated protein